MAHSADPRRCSLRTIGAAGPRRRQLGHHLAAAGDDDLLAGFDPVEQLAEPAFIPHFPDASAF